MDDDPPTSDTQHIARISDGISVAVGPDDGPNASRADEIVRAEIARLEHMFNIDDDTSMLNRWIRDPSMVTTGEFDRLLTAALAWQRVSRGAYNVSVGRLRDLWKRAAIAGCRPSPGEIHELIDEIAEAPYRFEDKGLRQLRNCSGLDFSGVVPGFAVDGAAELAMNTLRLGGLTVSASNRYLHRGNTATEKSLDRLARPFGLSDFVLRNAAATVSLEQGHVDVLDPLTGSRVSTAASVLVVAPNAIASDAIATAIRTLPTERALDFVRELNEPRRAMHPSQFSAGIVFGPIRCWIRDPDGAVRDADDHRTASRPNQPATGEIGRAWPQRADRRDGRRLTLPWTGSRTVKP